VSSNIHEDEIDPGSYGQDLSHRPYLVSMPLLSNAAFQGALLCDIYTSQITQCPCVTVMHGVSSAPATLGCTAADMPPDACYLFKLRTRHLSRRRTYANPRVPAYMVHSTWIDRRRPGPGGRID
jgi:hypothetical protein